MKKIVIILMLIVRAVLPSVALSPLDRMPNRLYVDDKQWTMGFSVGTHVQNIKFTHNGFIAAERERWFIEQPSYSPGFCVNVHGTLRLNEYFSLRVSPGMYFGNRDITMREYESGTTVRQNLKSAYAVLPVDVKFASQRTGNMRPYLTAGIMPTCDVTKKQSDYLKLKSAELFATVGVGCDFYLPYFKLIPELKFCFGLTDALQHERGDLAEEPDRLKFTQSLKKAVSQMVVLTFYFE